MRLYITQGMDNRWVYHIPVDHMAVPRRVTSADVTVVDLRVPFDSDERVLIALEPAFIDPLDEALVAEAGASSPHPTRIPITDASAVVEGRSYLLSSLSSSEVVKVRQVDTDNDMVYVEHELRGVYLAGSMLQGLELSVEIPTNVIDLVDGEEDEGGPYGVIWTYTIADEPYHPIDDLYLRRHSLPAWCREPDVLQAYPRLARRTRDSFEVTQAIASATLQTKAELELARVKPETLASDVLREVVVCRSVALCLRWLRSNDSPSDEDDIEYYEGRANVLARSLLNGTPPARTVDVPSSGAGTSQRRKSYDEIFRRG